MKLIPKLACASLFCALLINTTQAATTIRVTLQLPETHSLGLNWLAFKDIIEKESGGELELQYIPFGTTL